MGTNRIEAFSDGVIAIIITIMVLELKAPHEPTMAALLRLTPPFLSYGLSFLVVAIMWVNHHHLMHLAKRAEARLLWTNNTLLFWMSLIPVATAYMGEHHREPMAVALYGGVLALCAASFTLLRHEAARQSSNDPELQAHHEHILRKNLFTTCLYASSAPLAYVSRYVSFFIFVLIPVLYFLPERRLTESRE
jgi:uncharacterized membrane protein